MYVDNFGGLGDVSEKVEKLMNDFAESCDGVFLLTHKATIECAAAASLGVALNGWDLCTQPLDERIWGLDAALAGLAMRGAAAGWVVEVIVGHCTFVGLCFRMSLSCFHTIYAFIQANYRTPQRLWPSVVAELKAFRGLLVLMASWWATPWSPLVLQSDSSMEGWGIQYSV